MLRLVFRSASEADGLECRLDHPDLRDQPWVPIAAPLSRAELDDLRWYIEDFLQLPVGAEAARAKRIEATLRPVGERLYRAAFPDVDAGLLLARVLAAGEWLEVAAEPGTPAAPLGWPWELLADARGFLAQRKLRVRRTVPRRGVDDAPKPPSPHGLRVLLVVSRPDGAGMVPYDSVDAALRAVDEAPVRLDVAPTGSLAVMREHLDRAIEEGHPYDVVHFDGHGDYDPKRGAVLLFEEPATPEMTLPADLVGPGELGALLADKGVDLVLLEACRSSTAAAEAAVTAGFAQGLLLHGVPAVIAMGYTVHVDATKVLCAELYARLAKGHTVGEALSGARRRLQVERRRRVGFGPLPERPAVELSDWFVPQLYAATRGDVALLGPDAAPPGLRRAKALPALDPANPAPGAFPPGPLGGFVGRLAELHRVERALYYRPAVRISGLGGMGKTALAREVAAWLQRTGRIEGAAFVSFERAAGVEHTLAQMSAALIGGEAGADREAVVRWFRRYPVLVVWDNLEVLGDPALAEEAAGLARLFAELTGDDGGRAPAGRLLLTSRDPGQFAGAWGLALGGLWRPDARQLLDEVLQRRVPATTYAAVVRGEGAIAAPAGRAEAQEDAGRRAVDGLLEVLGRHPLSIELVGPSLGGQRPGVIAEALAARMAAAGDAPGEEAARLRALRAALDWAIGQLGAEAREALPWLAVFRGGVFEQVLLTVSGLDPARWASARGDLARTGLVRVDGAVEINGRPFLALHPTLALLEDGGRSADPAVRARFGAVYAAVVEALDRAKGGDQAAFRWGLAVFGRAEANLRRALGWAKGDRAALIQRGLVEFLTVLGRRTAAEQVAALEIAGALSPQARIRGALDRLARDRASALSELQALAAALAADPAADPFDTALAFTSWGRAHLVSGESSRAVAPLRAAVGHWRAVVDARPDDPARVGNLSATLGDLGNALMETGDLAGAEAALREGLALAEARRDRRSVAAGWGGLARLAAVAGRYDDARAGYARSRDAAAALGDDALVGAAEQHLGGLERGAGDLPAAIAHYRRALDRFLAAGHRAAAMQTRDLLGSAWVQRGDRATARDCYQAALGDAEALGDTRQQAGTRHNLGILELSEADAARAAKEADAADRHLRAAATHVGAALALHRRRGDRAGEASSQLQLGVIYRHLGRLADARAALEAGLAFRAGSGTPDVHKDHHHLAEVCAALGDADAAAAHRAQAATARAHAAYNARRHHFLAGLAQLAAAARARRGLAGPDAAFRDTVAKAPDWLGALAGFFTALAEPDTPPPTLPAGLPDDLRATLSAVLDHGADPFDALPPEVQANPRVRAHFGRAPRPAPANPAPPAPPTPDLFRHLCLALAAPEPPPSLDALLAALAAAPDPEHRAIAAHLSARRRGAPPPPLPPHLAAIAAEVLPD